MPAVTALDGWSRQSVMALVGATALASSAATAVAVALYRRAESRRRGVYTAKPSALVYTAPDSSRQYMEFHFTPGAQSFERQLSSIEQAFDFPIRVARLFDTYKPRRSTPNQRSELFGAGRVVSTSDSGLRGLDIGCATGSSVLEMSKYFDGEVVGVDFSAAFIDLAKELIEKGGAEYSAPDQGLITTPRLTTIPADCVPGRCRFHVGDAMNLLPGSRASLRASGLPNWEDFFVLEDGDPKFDGVLAANLLCRVPDPGVLLDSFRELLNPGGVLVLVSPYSWWSGASDPETWIGGLPGGLRSEELVKQRLATDFELLHEGDEPFLIRDHSRRYQLGFSHCTVWRKT